MRSEICIVLENVAYNRCAVNIVIISTPCSLDSRDLFHNLNICFSFINKAIHFTDACFHEDRSCRGGEREAAFGYVTECSMKFFINMQK